MVFVNEEEILKELQFLHRIININELMISQCRSSGKYELYILINSN